MLVSEVMTTLVVSIRADAPIQEAVELLHGRRISALPVTDAEEHVIGILSEADVLRQPLQPDPRAHLRPATIVDPPLRTVLDAMSSDPVCASSQTDCAEVAKTMVDAGWKSLPVVDDSGRLVGMVSRSDLVRSMTRTDRELQESLIRAFSQAGHPEWTATVQAGHVMVDASDGPVQAALAVVATVEGVRGVRVGP